MGEPTIFSTTEEPLTATEETQKLAALAARMLLQISDQRCSVGKRAAISARSFAQLLSNNRQPIPASVIGLLVDLVSNADNEIRAKLAAALNGAFLRDPKLCLLLTQIFDPKLRVTREARTKLESDLTEHLTRNFLDDPHLSGVLWEAFEWPRPFAMVFQEELRQIRARREAVSGVRWDADNGLFGVAFSGGGIRSATFNLGILQRLAEFNLLDRVDYLSTVSGGGYIGSWLAAWITRKGLNSTICSLSPDQSRDPSKAMQKPIRFLREFSNYLTPRLGSFSFDSWTAVAVYTRNVGLNQAVLVTLLAALLLLPRFMVLPMLLRLVPYGVVDLCLLILSLGLLFVAVYFMARNLSRATAPEPRPKSESARNSWIFDAVGVQLLTVAPMLLAVYFGSLWLWRDFDNPHRIDPGWGEFRYLAAFGFFAILSLRFAVKGGYWQCYSKRLLGGGICARLAVLALIVTLSAGTSVGFLFAYAKGMTWLHGKGHLGLWNAVIWGPVTLLTVLVVPGILQIGLMGVDFPDSGREWTSRFRAVCSIYTLYWVGLLSVAIYGPLLVFRLAAGAKVWISGLTLTWVATTISGFLAGSSQKTGKDKEGTPSVSWLQLLAKLAPPVFALGLVTLIATLEQLLLVYARSAVHSLSAQQLIQNHWSLLIPSLAATNWWVLNLAVLAFLLAAGLILAWRVDINEFSMHHFYKNRLARCYLGASNDRRTPNPFTGFDESDDFPLSQLKATDPKQPYLGPYPIINATLNISAGKQLAWQERKAESFVLTPCFCGFEVATATDGDSAVDGSAFDPNLRPCGYRKTDQYAKAEGPNLGTAMSISGAAADPNQGYNTSPTVAFLMTMFDVRLGWWLGNPRRDLQSKLPSPIFGLGALLSELLGRTDDTAGFVSLSDGGHFDNMGIYELVRRRCRFIILCDAEQDPSYQFGGLGMAIRRCRIDFGAQIEIEPAPIVPKDGKLSESHCAVGTITYVDGSEGTLVYIKASLTGDEPEDVLEYHASESHFPHESTADQWFKESQFESYRILGYHAADRTLAPAKQWCKWNHEITPLEELFEALESVWYPMNPNLRVRGSKHTGTLADLLDKLREDKGLHSLGAQLFPESGLATTGERKPAEEFYFCMCLIQLVEDFFFEFELDREKWSGDPRIEGWTYLFRTWKTVPAVAETWRSQRNTFRKDFQLFWERLKSLDNGL